MTTFAYRDGVLAGDTRAYGYDSMPIGTKQKVVRLDDSRLLGVSSVHLGHPTMVEQWLRGGCPEDRFPDLREQLEGLLVYPDGTADVFDCYLTFSRVEAPFYACGSGKEYALAAMHLGLTAVEAVSLACELDVWSAHPVIGIDHDGNRITKRLPGRD